MTINPRPPRRRTGVLRPGRSDPGQQPTESTFRPLRRLRLAVGLAAVQRTSVGEVPAAWLTVTVTAVLAVGYLRWTPPVPDLLAQVARAGVAARAGDVSWWTGWFGGLSLPTYSVLVPPWMASIGAPATGAIAAVLGAVGGAVLMQQAPRPRLGSVAYAVASMADLLAGRVTFAVGLAIGTWALVAIRSRRPALAMALAAAAYLASPLAGLFVGLVLLAVMVFDRTRRRVAIAAAAVLVLLGAGMSVLFPGTGVMPITVMDLIPTGVACGVIALGCRTPIVRRTAILTGLALPVVLIFPGAVGSNITRLAWVCAVPVFCGYSNLSRRWFAAAGTMIAVWPVGDLASQVQASADPSTRAAYYVPLVDAVRKEQALAGPRAVGQRIEAVETVSHGADAYLAPSIALARGWDRQADRAYNTLFYARNALTADSYHAWLQELAVGWVALPRAPLDYAAAAESALIRAGLPYLSPTWRSTDWTLYRVTDAEPLADGAQIQAVGDSSVTLNSPAPSVVRLRLRWSPYFVLIDPATGRPDPAACTADHGGWTSAYLPRDGTFQLVSRFDIRAQWASTKPTCPIVGLPRRTPSR